MILFLFYAPAFFLYFVHLSFFPILCISFSLSLFCAPMILFLLYAPTVFSCLLCTYRSFSILRINFSLSFVHLSYFSLIFCIAYFFPVFPSQLLLSPVQCLKSKFYGSRKFPALHDFHLFRRNKFESCIH